jgi:hypothetical protein
MKAEVTNRLRLSPFKIHYSFDMWSGPNRHTYQVIIAHWLDGEGKLHTTLLSIRRFVGTHSGINQANHFLTTVEEYGVMHSIGKFNVDNASNNDTALVEISRRIQEKGYPSFDPVTDRLRCFGHVLNLVVKAFLWGNNVTAFELEANDINDELAAMIAWRQKGPLGKLHNILEYIRKTP